MPRYSCKSYPNPSITHLESTLSRKSKGELLLSVSTPLTYVNLKNLHNMPQHEEVNHLSVANMDESTQQANNAIAIESPGPVLNKPVLGRSDYRSDHPQDGRSNPSEDDEMLTFSMKTTSAVRSERISKHRNESLDGKLPLSVSETRMGNEPISILKGIKQSSRQGWMQQGQGDDSQHHRQATNSATLVKLSESAGKVGRCRHEANKLLDDGASHCKWDSYDSVLTRAAMLVSTLDEMNGLMTLDAGPEDDCDNSRLSYDHAHDTNADEEDISINFDYNQDYDDDEFDLVSIDSLKLARRKHRSSA